ncbi:MAG: hypothetical protein JRN67_11125 [Nitrososphaerota archaeon]|nr:hypothetical protein [Nitrososphaerota archaeon]
MNSRHVRRLDRYYLFILTRGEVSVYEIKFALKPVFGGGKVRASYSPWMNQFATVIAAMDIILSDCDI